MICLAPVTRKPSNSRLISAFFVLLMSVYSSAAFSFVTLTVTGPFFDASNANGHTFNGPVFYHLEYTTTSPSTFEITSDPSLFGLVDEDGERIDDVVLYISTGDNPLTQRVVRIEQIGDNTSPPLQGLFNLKVEEGSAGDLDGPVGPWIGLALILGEEEGDAFILDKTRPVGVLTGPLDLNSNEKLLVEAGSTGEDGSVYYEIDFSVEHLTASEQSYTEADIFLPSRSAAEDEWVDLKLYVDGENGEDDDDWDIKLNPLGSSTATAQAKWNGTVVTIKLSNITAPENVEVGFRTNDLYDHALAADFAGNTNEALNIDEDTFTLNDNVGPAIGIGAPSPATSEGEDVSFLVTYTGASSITLSVDDISLTKADSANADIEVEIAGDGFSSAEVILKNISGEGHLAIQIAAASAVDESGDLAPESELSEFVVVTLPEDEEEEEEEEGEEEEEEEVEEEEEPTEADLPECGDEIGSIVIERVLYIAGSNGDDSIQVSDAGDQWKVAASFHDGDLDTEEFYDKDDVDSIVIFACAGDDQIDTGGVDIPTEIYGGDGDDQIQAGEGDDYISGGQGDDQISGGDGDDTIFGSEGDDEIQGDDGNDVLVGGDGDDQIQGGDGDDELLGGQGDDELQGGNGDNIIDQDGDRVEVEFSLDDRTLEAGGLGSLNSYFLLALFMCMLMSLGFSQRFWSQGFKRVQIKRVQIK